MKTYKSIYNKVEKLEEKANALISEFGDNYVYSEDSETFFATYIECDKENNIVTITTNDYYSNNVQVYELDNKEDREEIKDYFHDLNIYLNKGKRHLKYYDINKEEEDEDYSTKFAESESEEYNEEEPAIEEESKPINNNKDMKSLEDEKTIKVNGFTFIYSLNLVRRNETNDIYNLNIRHFSVDYNFCVSFDGYNWIDETGTTKSKNLYYFVKRIILLNL